MYSGFLKIRLPDPRLASSLLKSLHPDNSVTPEFMSIEEELSNQELLIRIKIMKEGARYFDSLRGTLDDLASMIEMIIEIINEIEPGKIHKVLYSPN